MIALQTLWRLRIVALLLSFLFSLLVTISPRIPQLAVVRVKLSDNGTSVNEMRFGVWSYCLHRQNFDNDPCDTFSPCTNENRHRICSPAQYGYSAQVTHEVPNSGTGTFTVSRQWTRSFLVLIFSTVALFVTLATLFTPRPSIWISRLSLLTCFCALIICVLFSSSVENGLQKFDDTLSPDVEYGAGLELLIFSFILIVLEERARWYTRRKEAQSTLLPSSRSSDTSDVIALSSVERPSSGDTLAVPPAVYLANHLSKMSFECTICMEDGLKDFTVLPCGHAFCTRCTEKSLKLYKRCPLCNAEAHDRMIDYT